MYLEFPSKELWYEGEKEWSFLDHTLVHILVVVANRQVRTLSTDVRKGFDAIVLSIEWADLKTSPKGSKGSCLLLAASIGRKGNRLKSLCMVRGSVATPGSVWICRGDSNKHYEGSSDPMQSFLFCIKATVVQLQQCGCAKTETAEFDLIREANICLFLLE